MSTDAEMNLTEGLDRLEERWGKGSPFDPLLWAKMAVLREMARRIKALEEAMGEHRVAYDEVLNP